MRITLASTVYLTALDITTVTTYSDSSRILYDPGLSLFPLQTLGHVLDLAGATQLSVAIPLGLGCSLDRSPMSGRLRRVAEWSGNVLDEFAVEELLSGVR